MTDPIVSPAWPPIVPPAEPVAGRIAALLGERLAAFEHWGGDEVDLSPAERQLIAHATPRRVSEFARGRACARRALKALGIHDFDLMSRPDRSPIWPAGVVGSITHTAAYAAAAVAPAEAVRGIGIDAEEMTAVTADLWPTLFTSSEQSALALAPDQGQILAAVLFSAKEAFYKAQYPHPAPTWTFKM